MLRLCDLQPGSVVLWNFSQGFFFPLEISVLPDAVRPRDPYPG